MCNGKEFALYETKNRDSKPIPIFKFKRSELLDKWNEILNNISVQAFQDNTNDLTISFRQIIPNYDFQKKQDLLKWILSFILDKYGLKFINEQRNLNIDCENYADFIVKNSQNFIGLIRYIYNKSHNKYILDKEDIEELISQFIEYEKISYIYLITTVPIGSDTYNYIEKHNKRRINEKIELLGDEKFALDLMEYNNLHIPAYKAKCAGNVENIKLLATDNKKLYWAVEEINQQGESDRVLIFSTENEQFNIDLLKSSLHQNKLFVGYSIVNGDESMNEDTNTKSQTASQLELLRIDQEENYEIPIPHIPIADSFESDSACSPKDFIGREDIKNEFWDFINDVKNKKTDKRVFTIEGKSGYGKSSLILKLEQESQSKDNIFFYQVDIRLLCLSSEEPFIVRSAIKTAIQESIEQKFTDLNGHDIFISREGFLFYDNKAINKFINFLRSKNKIIIICFDQFDYLFSRNNFVDTYRELASIAAQVHSLQDNFILGFSCRTGIPLPEGSIRDEWNELKDIRRVFEVKEFNDDESEEYLNKFSQLLNQDKNIKIAFVKNWLKENFGIFPYLLRQICGIIYKNSDVLSIVHRKIEDLIKENFDQELNKLKNTRQYNILMKIAQDDKISFLEESDEKEIRMLVSQRFLIYSEGKYTIPDIRKEYYLSGKLPEISTKYIPRMNVNGSLYAMRNINKYKTKEELLQYLIDITYTKDTADNFWIDIQNVFYVANDSQNQNDHIAFPEELNNHNQSSLDDYQIAEYLYDYFRRHLIVKEILKKDCIRNAETFDRETFRRVYSEIAVNRSKESKNDDPSRLLTWLCFAGIFECIKSIKRYRVPKKEGSGKNKGKILECVMKITEQDKIANNLENPKQLGLFN